MATTTNYSWTTPDDTALVKDGAAAIRSLGTAIDTTTKNLNPETTLGDLAYRSSTANVKTRLGLGTAGQVLQVNSGATAPEWATLSTSSITTISTTSLSNRQTDLTSIPQTYTDLILVIAGASWPTFSTSIDIRPNGSTTLSHSVKILNNNGTVSTSADSNTVINAPANVTNMAASNANNIQYYIFKNYASTTMYKPFEGYGYFETSNSASFLLAGGFKSTSAISSITLYLGQNVTYSAGSAILYGVK